MAPKGGKFLPQQIITHLTNETLRYNNNFPLYAGFHCGIAFKSAIAEFIVSQKLGKVNPGSIVHDSSAGLGEFTLEFLKARSKDMLTVERASNMVMTETDPLLLCYGESALRSIFPTVPLTTFCSPMDQCIIDSSVLLTTRFLPPGREADFHEVGREIYRTLLPTGMAVMVYVVSHPIIHAVARTFEQMKAESRKQKLTVPLADSRTVVQPGRLVDVGYVTVDTQAYHFPLEIADLRRLVTTFWSCYAEPLGGWKKEDEDDWDACIEKCLQLLKEDPDVECFAPDGAEITMSVDIVMATMK